LRYKYQALDSQGQEVSGIFTAESDREVIRQLQRRGLTILQVTSVTTTRTTARLKKPKHRDILVVLHELATLLESGVSLIEAIESLANSTHHPFIVQVFANIALQLRQGTSFSIALKNSPLKLPWYLNQLAEAGELTGQLATALREGVQQMEYELRISGEMRNAMIYPLILIFSGIVAVLTIFTVVVPRFAGILKNRMDDLPFLAKAVLSTGLFFNQYLQWIAGGLVVISIVMVYLFTQPQWRNWFKDAVARLPFMGYWMIEAETARWSATMSTLLGNRVSLLRSLELAEQSIQLPSLRARLAQVTKAVRAGTSLSQALQDQEALTPTGHNLIRAGERSGEVAKMLRSLAKLLEESGRLRMKRFLLLIEPLAILMIGGVMGVIITGVILAITSVHNITF
jgi:general secretion pathway protein F